MDTRRAGVCIGSSSPGLRRRPPSTARRRMLSISGDERGRVWEAGYFNDDDRSFHRTFDRHVNDLLSALREGR